jgi:hypothetical protein
MTVTPPPSNSFPCLPQHTAYFPSYLGRTDRWVLSRLSCLIPWGENEGGDLLLVQLGMEVELTPGDAFFL